MRRLALAAAVAMACALAADAGPPVVRYDAGRLSVRADDADVAEILREIARATGASLEGTLPEHRVTLALDAVPLEEALGALVGKQSFSLVYRPDGALRAIEFLAASDRTAPGWPPAAGPAEPPADGTSPERQREVMGRPVAVGRRLAAALGTRHPTAGQVILAALRQKSAKVRAEAQDRALEAFARDPELEEVFLQTLAVVEDATLARLLRQIGGPRAEEFMEKLSEQARSEALRAKSGRVLERMRDPAEDSTS